MNSISENEKLFIEALESHGLLGLELERDQHGTLIVSLKSPCAEIGALSAFLYEHEVALSCKVSHHHVDRVDSDLLSSLNTQEAIYEKAAKVFIDFINEKIYVSEHRSSQGDLISSGWGPVKSLPERNPEFDKLIEQQYGNLGLKKYWVWSGEITYGL